MTSPPTATRLGSTPADADKVAWQADMAELARDCPNCFVKVGSIFGAGRWSHFYAPLHISLVIIHTKYAGWRDNDFNVYA